MRYKMNIPSNRRQWYVELNISAVFGTTVEYFYICPKRWHNGVAENAVPKSIRDKARCFLANPELFGRRYPSF